MESKPGSNRALNSDRGLPYPEHVPDLGPGEIRINAHSPETLHVVMGANGKPDQEVYREQLTRHGIPLYRRKGGGGTVLLGPHCIVLTLSASVAHQYRSLEYFQAINRSLIEVFQSWAVHEYGQRGISDIAVADRKLVGSSIFRRRHLLLFQASILVEDALDWINRCLRHPPREPDYRANRRHHEFMTSLRQLGIELPTAVLLDDLKHKLNEPALREIRLADQLIASQVT